MKIIPRKVEYYFEVGRHKLCAKAEKVEDKKNTRRVSFFFNDELVYNKEMPDGDYVTYDDCIHDCAEEYKSTYNNKFSDLFKYHSDQVHLNKKIIVLTIDNGFVLIDANLTITKDSYRFSLSSDKNTDRIEGEFKAVNFSEALEKTRIMVNILEDVNFDMAEHIKELSDDKIMKLISWTDSEKGENS